MHLLRLTHQALKNAGTWIVSAINTTSRHPPGREQVAAFLRHHQQGRKSRKPTAGSGSGSQDESTPRWLGWAGEGRESDGGGGLPFGYYLDIDALGVARAAAQCGAQCSALFYAEAWVEGRFGEAAGITASRWRDQGEGSGDDGLDGGDDFDLSGGGDAGREKREVERLLLDVFSSLPEPDSIYGVPAPPADLSAQATVYAHEGGWQKTLPAYDTLLQHQIMVAVGGAAATGGMVTSSGLAGAFGSLPGIGLQTGIATSLQVRAGAVLGCGRWALLVFLT